MARKCISEDEKSRVASASIFIIKWLMTTALTLLLYTLHDFAWFSSINPFYWSSPTQVFIPDSILKGIILLVVYKYILPQCPKIGTIIMYSVMLSWLAMAQNLPEFIGNSGDALWVVFVAHAKYSVILFQKFTLFKFMNHIQA